MSNKMLKLTVVKDPHRGRNPGELPKYNDERVDLQADPRKFLWFCKLVPCEFIGTEKEKANTVDCRIQVDITASCVSTWNMYRAESANDLVKLAFGIGMMELKKWMESDGEPKKLPVIKVDSSTYEKQCPLDPSMIQPPIIGAQFALQIEQRIGFQQPAI